MKELTVFGNPLLLLLLAAVLLLWIYAIQKRGILLFLFSFLLLTALLIFSALHGAGYEELIIVLLVFVLPGILAYDGSTEEHR